MLASCEADKINSSPDVRLAFSCDTLRFDTIFTDRGSATKRIKIYNTTPNKLVISSVKLNADGAYSINLKGEKGSEFMNLTMDAKDSLVAYVQVYIDPTDETTPFIVRDSLMFLVNGNEQKLYLESYGQNALRFKSHTFESDTVITDYIPVLITDTIIVKEGVRLTLKEGASLYFCKYAVMLVEGTLRAEGTLENPVLLRGDRSDYMNTSPPLSYDQSSAQWGGIRLRSTSRDNVLRYATMRNATFGIMTDSMQVSEGALRIENCKIYNSSDSLITTLNADVTIHNSLIYNSGGALLDVTGGKAEVLHCTFANYYGYTWGGRNLSSIVLRNRSKYGTLMPLTAKFYNDIIYGTYNNEITFTKAEEGEGSDADMVYSFVNCHVKQLQSNLDEHYVGCIVNISPGFLFENWSSEFKKQNPHLYDFHLQGGSPSIGKANFAISLTMPYDLDGYSRTSDGSSDIGCYEYK